MGERLSAERWVIGICCDEFFLCAGAPTVLYGSVLFMGAIAYLVLQRMIIRAQGPNSILREAVGRDWKGKLSLVLSVEGIAAAFRSPIFGEVAFALAALIWFIRDRRIEERLSLQSGPSLRLESREAVTNERDARS